VAATPSGARAVPPQGARRSSHALGRVGGASTGLVAGTGVGTSCPDRSCSALCSRAAPCLQLAGSGTKKHLWTMHRPGGDRRPSRADGHRPGGDRRHRRQPAGEEVCSTVDSGRGAGEVGGGGAQERTARRNAARRVRGSRGEGGAARPRAHLTSTKSPAQGRERRLRSGASGAQMDVVPQVRSEVRFSLRCTHPKRACQWSKAGTRLHLPTRLVYMRAIARKRGYGKCFKSKEFREFNSDRNNALFLHRKAGSKARPPQYDCSHWRQ
jgi:hypothetical protein